MGRGAVTHVMWVAAFTHWDKLVNLKAVWMSSWEPSVNRQATQMAHGITERLRD